MSYNTPAQNTYPPSNETSTRWGKPGQYTGGRGDTQIDANWDQASSVAGNQPPQHFNGATGPHFDNFTGAQGNPTGPQGGYPNTAGHNSTYYDQGPTGTNPAPAANLYHADQNFQQPVGTMTGNVAGPAPAPGTGAAAGIGTGTRQVDNNYANTGASVGTVAPVGTMNAKPSMGSRVIGEAEKMAGELTGNPKLVERGELKKAFHQCSA